MWCQLKKRFLYSTFCFIAHLYCISQNIFFSFIFGVSSFCYTYLWITRLGIVIINLMDWKFLTYIQHYFNKKSNPLNEILYFKHIWLKFSLNWLSFALCISWWAHIKFRQFILSWASSFFHWSLCRVRHTTENGMCPHTVLSIWATDWKCSFSCASCHLSTSCSFRVTPLCTCTKLGFGNS